MLRTFFLIQLILLVGCTQSSSDGTSSGAGDLSLRQVSTSGESDDNGVVTLTFAIPSGVNGAQLIANSSSNAIEFHEARGVDGRVILSQSQESIHNRSHSPEVVNLPITTPGNYSISLNTLRPGTSRISPHATVRGTLVLKSDPDLSRGTLRVNMNLVGPVADSTDLRDSLEAAVSDWQQIFDRAQIKLDVKWYDFAGGASIPNPYSGSSFYETISNATRHGALNVVVASRVVGTTTRQLRFGIAGSTPGSFNAGPTSAVSLSILHVTGDDGRFNLDPQEDGATEVHNDEVRLAAETLAQLAGSYLGVEHIVNFGDGSTRVQFADSFSDTPSCITITDCEHERDVRMNFMFPFPLRRNGRDSDKFWAREKITPQQAAMMNQSVLVE